METAANNAIKLTIEQELTIYTASEMKAQLMTLLENSSELEFDLSQVGEMDTAGLQLLILAKRECLARGGNLRLSNHSPAVLDVLDLCNMIQFFGDPVVISQQHNR